MFAVGNMFPARVDTIVGDEKIPSGAISYDMFKKMFFPQLYLVKEEPQSDEEREMHEKKRELKQDKHPKHLEERILNLDKQIRLKLGLTFTKVRKAFLSIDDNHKGYVTIEDLLKFLDGSISIDYNDLKKLLRDKDSTHQ